MVEGMSIRAIVRMTIVKLLADAGEAFTAYQDKVFRNLSCKRIQCDEVWSFCYAKEKNVPANKKRMFGYGDVWPWTAICADTKLVPSWFVSTRDGEAAKVFIAEAAKVFIADLASRLANRVQLTTDGHRAYLQAVEDAFGAEVDYAMLVKLYGAPTGRDNERRYSPAECTGTIKGVVNGKPKDHHVSTSYVERQNLSMRMGMRRFTRLTNAHSKKIENHEHAIAIYFMHYNFVRIHQTLRVTPAMEAGVTQKLMSLEEMVAIVDDYIAMSCIRSQRAIHTNGVPSLVFWRKKHLLTSMDTPVLEQGGR